MRTTLIYNADAGGGGRLTPEEVQEALGEAGYDAVYEPTEREEDLDSVLRGIEGLVVVAGGDGTVRAVATRLIGEDAAMAPLPMGTANNLCATLGIEGPPLEAIARLRQPRKCLFDIGHVKAPWGEDYFVEGAGLGFFADALHEYEPEKGKSILRGMSSVSEIFSRGFDHETIVHIDGHYKRGKFLLVELLNAPAIGPRLKFAPDADPTDGLIQVVFISASEREGFLSYMTSMLSEDLEKLSSVEVMQDTAVEIMWTGFPFHIDGEVRPNGDLKQWLTRPADESELKIRVEMIPSAVEFWTPEPKDNGS